MLTLEADRRPVGEMYVIIGKALTRQIVVDGPRSAFIRFSP